MTKKDNAETMSQQKYFITDGCSRCGACMGICEKEAILFDGFNYSIIQERCVGCGRCKSVCRSRVIKWIAQAIEK